MKINDMVSYYTKGHFLKRAILENEQAPDPQVSLEEFDALIRAM